jgi:acyl-[acyl-carrier-protein]-phospholipid O-acyltransferase / long-chain-fatty-acid--[acyl-carrier-protein] ligase
MSTMPDSPTMPSGAARTFPWLNFAQFSGALNDNLYKYFAVLSLIHSGALGKDSANYVAGFVFTLPFLLFSEIGGALADRFSKTMNIRMLKLVEVVVAALGVAALVSGHPVAILAVLFLLATHSALFAPNKYGIIPELVPVTGLSKANSQIQGMTYIAIIIGTVLAPQLGKWSGGRYEVAAWACVAVALAGYLASRGVARTPAMGCGDRSDSAWWPTISAPCGRFATTGTCSCPSPGWPTSCSSAPTCR